MGFIENLKNTLQRQKEQGLALEKRASKAWEAQAAANERAIKRARECLEASSFPRLAKELSEFIGAGVHIGTREVAGHFEYSGGGLILYNEEVATGKHEMFPGRDGGGRAPRWIKPYMRMEINWDYDEAHVYGSDSVLGYKYKHIGIHFEEDWKIHVIGEITRGIATTLSKNKWHGKLHEQEKALEKAYLRPAKY